MAEEKKPDEEQPKENSKGEETPELPPDSGAKPIDPKDALPEAPEVETWWTKLKANKKFAKFLKPFQIIKNKVLAPLKEKWLSLNKTLRGLIVAVITGLILYFPAYSWGLNRLFDFGFRVFTTAFISIFIFTLYLMNYAREDFHPTLFLMAGAILFLLFFFLFIAIVLIVAPLETPLNFNVF